MIQSICKAGRTQTEHARLPRVTAILQSNYSNTRALLDEIAKLSLRDLRFINSPRTGTATRKQAGSAVATAPVRLRAWSPAEP